MRANARPQEAPLTFVGTGTRLKAGDIARVAIFLGSEQPAVRAVIEVEAASNGFDALKRPHILFEPHIVYCEPLWDKGKSLPLMGFVWKADFSTTKNPWRGSSKN